MGDYKLKIKIGDHEFDADGPSEAVKEQFEAFKELIKALPTTSPKTSASSGPKTPEKTNETQMSGAVLDKIFHEEGRVISITISPNSEIDAVLLILYGQRFYRDNQSPTGSEIMDGMEQSGYRAVRIDRILLGLSNEGAVIITGAHRGKRYRLTNQGFNRADKIVRDALGK